MHQHLPDVVARYEGTVGSIEPRTPRAGEWLREHLSPYAPRLGQWWAVEDAYFESLVAEMREAGLVVEVLQAGCTY